MATLNENILKIKSTFDEIATAIEQKGVPVGECDSPTTYANKIRSIAGSGTGIEPYDFSAEVYELPDSAKEPVVNTTVTDSGEVIFTFGIRRGEKGVPGAKGEKGEQGPAGKDAVGIESTEVSYGINDSGVIEPSSWTPQIPHPDPGKYMWTKTTWTYTDGSSNTGKQVTYISKDGVNGADGADGMDGSVYEYVYFRGITADDRPPKPTGGNNVDDFEPTYTKTVYVNGNPYVLEWSDKAQGVDEVYKFEWQSERKKETTSTWGNFTEPILWAKYGEKGKDGDGVQYIFTTTDKQSAPDNPTPDNWEIDPEYQNNESEEYIPKPVDGQVWKDDPIEVDDVNRYCWVSIRKYRNGKWGKYSNPTLWTKWVDSSGAVTGDVVVIDMDPDWVMLNEDENTVSTTITAFRGDDPVIIKDVIADSGDYTFSATSNDGGKTWNITISNVAAKSSTTSIKINVKLSETSTRTKTFTIYHTQFDKETVSVDFGDDNILVPCSDGNTPDEGFFTNFEIPVIMRVAGEIVEIKSITPDKNPECFEITSAGNIKVKDFPGTAQKASVKFTVSDGANAAEGYVNFTKFNTAGGTLSMYTLNVDANDIVCDTRHNKNEYTVYAGKKGKSDNIIKVSINKYSSKEGNTVIPVSELTEKYRVYYANDPEDWSEDANSTLGEYLPITNNGIEIGKDISPDKCVSFQLREWVGEGTPWSDMSEDNYKVWDSENILVDIIRDIASYQFVVTPNKIHRNVNGEIVVPQNQKIIVGLSKNKAGDGETKYEALSVIPAGYDIYCEKDNNGNPEKFGEEHEDNALPVEIDVRDVTNSIVLTLVVNENSEDDGQVVLSETVEITSDVPGESAYVGYLTDSLGVVSCDANGNPTAGQEFETTFKVTNGEVTSIDSISGVGFTAEISGNTIVFKEFTQDLPETTKLTISATYLAKDGIEGKEESTYTIVKLKVADASTILDFSNDNVVVPCDENGIPYVDSVSTFVTMLHGDDALTLESSDVELGIPDSKGYYKITLNGIKNLPFTDGVYNKELTFKGTSESGEFWTRKGQLILTKLKAGESGEIWDLVLNADTPKWNNDSDKFDDDYIEGWVNIWGADKWDIASYNTLAGAERYIVCKTNEETTTYVPLTSDDFAANGHFKIYINPQDRPENAIYLDIDKSDGAKIALAKKENGQYIPIQEEIIRASFDGRDFSKFELVLSDGAIYQTYKDGAQTTVTPNEIKVLGVFEHNGPNRTKYEGTLHAQHIAGLDIYYAIDAEPYSEFNEEMMIEFRDTGNDGWANNDKLPITIGDIFERLDVYLVAHYNAPGDNSEETVYQIVDHKELLVVPIDLPGDVEIAHLELSQDEVKVPIDEKGDVDPDFKVSIIPYVYVNDDLNNDPVEYVFGGETQPTTGWTNNKSEFTASDFGNNHSYIWFRCESRKLYKKCKITKELNPVEIFIDRTVVKRDLSTNKVNDTVTIEIKKWDYNSNVWEAATGYSVAMKYTTVEDSNEKSVVINNSGDKYVAPLSAYAGINYIKFVISKDGVEKGFEEVGVITDGMDGSSREVIYYKSSIEGAPKDPTPEDTSGAYQNDDTTPLDWFNAGAYENMTEEEAAKWVDEYPGVNDTDCKYVYVSERKRTRGANSEWGSFSQPHLYAKYVVDGTPGAPALTAQLTNPASIVQYSGGKFLNQTVETDMFVRLGSAEQIIQKIEIESIKKNGSDLNKEYITCVPSELNTIRPTIKFTLTDNITVESQVITIDIKATVGDTITIVETKTIKIETAGGESVALLDFTNDYLPVKLNAGDGYGFPVHTGVRVYYGTQLCNISELILDFNGRDIPNNYDGVALWSFDNNVLTFEKDFPGYLENADFAMEDFSLNITAKANVNGTNRDLSGELNFSAQYGDSASLSIFPDVINYANGAQIDIKVVEPDGTELDYDKWKDKYEVRIDGNLIYSSSQSIASNRENPVDVTLHLKERLIDRETLPILKDGVDYEGYHIIPNHYEITYDPDGNVRTPNENIYPIITYQKGSNYVKLKDSDWSIYGLTVKYTIDGGDEQTYSKSINPSTIKEQLKFYLYESGKRDWRDYTEVDVTYEHNGPAGESTLVYDFTNNHIPVVPHLENYGLGNGIGTEIHVYYGLEELSLERYNNTEISEHNQCITVKYNEQTIQSFSDDGSIFYWEFNENTKIFYFKTALIDWLMAKDAKAEYWKLDITVQVIVGDQIESLTKGLYFYKAESLRPKLSITPNVIKVGETTELQIQVLGADNKLVNEWYDNGYTIKINDGDWNPANDDEKYTVGNPVALNIVLSKDDKFADAETIPVLRDGESKLSPIIYPAGEFKLGVQYEGTAIKAPYVLYDGVYYIAYGKPDIEEWAGTNIIDDPDWSNIPEGQGEGGWIEMATFEAIYADIGIIKEALVGPLVFHGNYVFSQDGKGANDDNLTNYEKALAAFPGQTISAIIDNKNWIPNLLFNAKTGTGHFAKGKIQWTEDTITIDGYPVVTEVNDELTKEILHLNLGDYKVFTLMQEQSSSDLYLQSEYPLAAPAITATSDMTLKDVVKDVELSVDDIANAPAFVFDWKDGSGRSVGTSAQYWQDVLPEAVLKGGNDKLSLAYGNTALVGMISLARTVKEQNEKIAKLESLVEELLNKLS